MERESVEILSPAGNIECARAALGAGTDAIYLGYSSFSARAGAENFDDESLKEIIREAHLSGAKVYVAMNTLAKDEELREFVAALLKVWSFGADAIIMQDIFLGRAIKKVYPAIVLHLSTQAGVCNENGALFAKECGFSRVILARETKFEEIEKITKIIETEAFVQGALCTCFSGQCYFSSFAGGQSGNRGRCKQPCRKKYAYDRAGVAGAENEEKNCAEKAYSGANGKIGSCETRGSDGKYYALSLSDLCLGEAALKLAEAGVKSFKTEGRMRRKEYVAAAALYYGKIFGGADEAEKSRALSDLKRAYNRGNYTQGLGFGQDKRLLSPYVQGHIGEKAGVVKVVNGKYFVETREEFSAGDAFKILRDKKEIGGASFAGKASLGAGKGGFAARGMFISSKERLKNGDGVFVTTDTKSLARVLSVQNKRAIFIDVSLNEGERGFAKCGGITVKTADVLGKAENRALTEEEIEECFRKTDGLPFEVNFSKIETKNAFLPKSLLNAFRREFYAALADSYAKTDEERGKLDAAAFFEHYGAVLTESNGGAVEATFLGVAAIARRFTGKEKNVRFRIAKPDDYTRFFGGEDGVKAYLKDLFGEIPTDENAGKYIYYPAYATAETEKAIAEAVKSGCIEGIYAENYSGAEFAKKYRTKLIFGTGANLTNVAALREMLQTEGLTAIVLSKEISAAEQQKIMRTAQKIAPGVAVSVLDSGDIKTMDLCYCPFGKTCGACDKREFYTLTDEAGRAFPVRRYKDGLGECRFEIFNCANLVSGAPEGATPLIDCTCERDVAGTIALCGDEEEQKNKFKNYTYGHAKNSVL